MSTDLRGEQLVYGDFSRLLNLQVSGDMEQISHTFRTIRNLDKSLYIGFVNFVLARAGFCNQTICEKWQIDAKNMEMEFAGCSNCDINPIIVREGKANWSTLIDCSFAWAEEVNDLWDKYGEAVDQVIYDLLSVMGTWSHRFEDIDGKRRVKVIFTEYLPIDHFEKIENLKNWEPLSAIDPSYSNLILVRPWAFKEARKNEKVLKAVCQKLQAENISLLSVDEFFDRFVSRAEKEIEVQNWIAIRTEVLENLLKENPVLIVALEWKNISKVELLLKTARQEYESARDEMDYEHAVRDATKACELLLQILFHKHFGKKPQDLAFARLKDQLKDMIETEYGEIVFSDLTFLYGWRNAEDHPKDVNLTNKDAFQVVNRSEAFYESIKVSLNEFEYSRFRLSSQHSREA